MSSTFFKTITLAKEHKVGDDEFVNLRDFIYEQCGIYIADNHKYLLEEEIVLATVSRNST